MVAKPIVTSSPELINDVILLTPVVLRDIFIARNDCARLMSREANLITYILK